MIPKIIFLDIDGVLNDHGKFPNGYSGMTWRCVEQFNRVLKAHPDANIVLTSAWRYLCLSKNMTAQGFSNMLLTHGLEIYDKTLTWTDADENYIPARIVDVSDRRKYIESQGYMIRLQQIRDYLYLRVVPYIDGDMPAFVVVDDMPLNLPPRWFVQTNGNIGMTSTDADRIISMLSIPNQIEG